MTRKEVREIREPFLINPPSKYARKRHHKSSGKGSVKYFKRKSNPVGETLITVGGNPMRYFRRSRNPVGTGLQGAMNVRGWGPLAVTGGLSAMATGLAPGMLAQFTGTNPWVQVGVRLAVAFGGGMAVGRYVSKEHGNVWTVVGTSLVAYDLLKEYVFKQFFPALGLSGYEYPGYEEQGDSQVNAFPNQVGTYPDEGGIQAFPLGSYPYDGAYGGYATAT